MYVPNSTALHRHTRHAWEDFAALRRDRTNEELWHSLSHHLRHSVWRSCFDVPEEDRYYVRRRT